MINKPAYQPHQISTGHYAREGEFVDETGKDYIGVYHIFPNDTKWAGETRSENSFQIFEKKFDVSPEVQKYRQLRGFRETNYVAPKYYRPVTTDYDRRVGRFERFFVQKINNPRNTITEIDGEQFTSINTRNVEGLNGAIWRGCLVEWEIKGMNIDAINRSRVLRAQQEYGFIGLENFIVSYLEYSI